MASFSFSDYTNDAVDWATNPVVQLADLKVIDWTSKNLKSDNATASTLSQLDDFQLVEQGVEIACRAAQFCLVDRVIEKRVIAADPSQEAGKDNALVDRAFKNGVEIGERQIKEIIEREGDLNSPSARLALTRVWQDRLVNWLKEIPLTGKNSDKPLNYEDIKKKIESGQVQNLGTRELIAAIKIESTNSELDKVFGPASQLALDHLNSCYVNASTDMVNRGIKVPVGWPILSKRSAENRHGDTYEGYTAWLRKLDLKHLKMLKEGEETLLLLGSPADKNRDVSSCVQLLLRFDENKVLYGQVQAQLFNVSNCEEANRWHDFVTEKLGLDRTKWSPPEDPAQLVGYSMQMNRLFALSVRMRNCAESIEQLSKLKGDFKTKDALSRGVFPGEAGTWDSKEKRLIGFKLDLPEGLAVTPSNERKLLQMEKWLAKYGPYVEDAAKDIMKGNPIRCGVTECKGQVGLDQHGKVVAVFDEHGKEILSLVKDGQLLTRGTDGHFYNQSGAEVLVTPQDLSPDRLQIVRRSSFDHMRDHHKFGVESGKIKVTVTRSYRQNYILDSHNWCGDEVASTTDSRLYAGDQLVDVQVGGESSKLVCAERLQRCLDNQMALQRLGEISSTAIDAAMLVSGTIQFKAAAYAGRSLCAGVAVLRGGTGGLGFLTNGLKKMGPDGEVVMTGRRWFINADIFQNLARAGIGKALGKGRPLFETQGAAEVHKIINDSWMRHLHGAAGKVFGVSNVYYLPTLSYGFYEKLVRTPDQILQDNLLGFETDGRQNEVKKVDWTNGIKEMLGTYEKVLALKGAAKQSAGQKFVEINSLLGKPELATKHSETELAKVYLPNGNQLQKPTMDNGDLPPKYLHGLVEAENRSDEDRLIASLGLLYLCRNADGTTASDGIILRRRIWIPAYEVRTPNPEGADHVRQVSSQPVDQSIHFRDVIATLREISLTAGRPETRIVAADALYRNGAISSGEYAFLLLDEFQKNQTNSGNREFRVQMLHQLSDLLVLRRADLTATGASGEQWLVMQGKNYGARPEDLCLGLLRIAGSDKDADVRALATSIFHAQHHEKKVIGLAAIAGTAAALEGDSVANHFKRYEQLKDTPGAFHKEVFDSLKRELETRIEGSKAQREAAIEMKLQAIETFRSLKEFSMDQSTFVQMGTAIDDCLKAFAKFGLSGEAGLSPVLAMRVLDLIVSSKDLLNDNRAKRIADITLAIMAIPYPEGGIGRTYAAMAKLAVMGQMDSLLPSSMVNDRREFIYSVRKIIAPSEENPGWGQFPEMRESAINCLFACHITDCEVVDQIAEYLKFDSQKTGESSFYERSPAVRLAAARAIYNMAGSRFCATKEEAQALEKNSQRLSTAQTIRPIAINELLERESDPAVLALLWQAYRNRRRIDPESADYKPKFDQSMRRISNAPLTEFTHAEADAFVTKHAEILGLFNKNKYLATINEGYKDPHGGEWGDWFGRLVTSDKKINSDRAHNSKLTQDRAHTDRYNKIEELAKFNPGNEEFNKTAPRFLAFLMMGNCKDFFQTVIGHDSNRAIAELIEGTDEKALVMARIRAGEMLLLLCSQQDSQSNSKVGDRNALAVVVEDCLLRIDPETTHPQIKFILFKCLDALSRTEIEKKDKRIYSPLISKEEAAELYVLMLDKEATRPYDNDPVRRNNHLALQSHIMGRLYQLRFTNHQEKLEAVAKGATNKEVAKEARDVLGEIRNGVAALYLDTPVDTANTALDIRAEFMSASLADYRFNYEDACIAIFKACKGQPIKDSTDPRAQVLLDALQHNNERVRLAAAWMLLESEDNKTFLRATDVLTTIAVYGSQERYKATAVNLLESVLITGTSLQDNFILDSWRKMYARRVEEFGSKTEKTEKTIDEIEQLTRFDPRLTVSKLQQSLSANEKARDRVAQKPAAQESIKRTKKSWQGLAQSDSFSAKVPTQGPLAVRVGYLSEITGRSKESIWNEVYTDLSPRPPVPKVIVHLGSAACHGGGQNSQKDVDYRPLLLRPHPRKTIDLVESRLPPELRPPHSWDEPFVYAPTDELEDYRRESKSLTELKLSDLEKANGVFWPVIHRRLHGGVQVDLPGQTRDLAGLIGERKIEAHSNNLSNRKYAQARTGLAIDLLELRSEQLNAIDRVVSSAIRKQDSAENVIQALRFAMDEGPIKSAADRRTKLIVGLAQSRDTDVRLEATSIILKGELIHPGFLPFHKMLAHIQLYEGVDTLLERIGKKNQQALHLLSLSLDFQKESANNATRSESFRASAKKYFSNLVLRLSDYVMQRQPNWQQVEKLLREHVGNDGLNETMPNGAMREMRIIRQGISFVDIKQGRIQQIKMPDGISYPDLLKTELSRNDGTAESRLKSANQLLDDGTVIGSNALHKKTALSAYALLCESKETPVSVQMAAARGLLDWRKEASFEQINKSLRCLVRVATTSTQDRDEVVNLVESLEPMYAQTALRLSEESLVESSRGCNDLERQRRAKVFFQLADKQKANVEATAGVYRIYAWAAAKPDSDIMSSCRDFIGRNGSFSVVSPLVSNHDPRMNAMAWVIDTNDETDPLVIHAALTLVAKESKAVKPELKERARVVLQKAIRSNVDSISVAEHEAKLEAGGTQTEKEKDILRRWEALDKLLGSIGQTEEDFGRLYIKSRRLEGKKDFSSLVKIYNQLANLSEERQSPTGAMVYRAKALEAQERLEREASVSTTGLAVTLKAARELVKLSERPQTEAQKAQFDTMERNISDALRVIEQKQGHDSCVLAEAHMQVARFYKEIGDTSKAEVSCQIATSIYQAQVIKLAQHPSPQARIEKPTVSQKGQLVNSWNDRSEEIRLSDDLTLRNSIDYLISKPAIMTGYSRILNDTAEKCVKENVEIFGKDSLQAARAYELYGDTKAVTANGQVADQLYNNSASIVALRLKENPFQFKLQYEQLALKRAIQLEMQGHPAKAHSLLEEAMKNLAGSGVEKNIIDPRIMHKAEELRQRAQLYGQSIK